MYDKMRTDLSTTIPFFVLGELRKRIIRGDYAPGERLREQALERQFKRSRGPIRESLRLLLQSGLVEHQPRRGFRVKDYSDKDLEDIYHLRAALEGMVINAISHKDCTPLIQALRSRFDRMKDAFVQRDLDGYFWENIAFHQEVIDFSENEPLAHVLFYSNEMSLPVRYLLLYHAFPSNRSVQYHENIINILAAGAFGEARQMTESHVLENLDLTKEVYRRQKKKSGRTSSCQSGSL